MGRAGTQGDDLGVECCADPGEHLQGEVLVALLDPVDRALARRQPLRELLRALPDDEATAIAVALARRLWRPAGAPFRWIGDHVPRWLDNAGDHYLVRQAKEIYATMHPGDTTLVHGDFHHHNLLSHRDGWVVIDPKPMVGDPEFDVPTFLWNPIGHEPTRESVERWIGAFADAGLDANLLRKWAIVRGTYQGLPLSQGLTAETSPALRVVRALL